jgi:hypothetical protein
MPAPAEMSTDELIREIDKLSPSDLAIIHELVMRVGTGTFDGIVRAVKVRRNVGPA